DEGIHLLSFAFLVRGTCAELPSKSMARLWNRLPSAKVPHWRERLAEAKVLHVAGGGMVFDVGGVGALVHAAVVVGAELVILGERVGVAVLIVVAVHPRGVGDHHVGRRARVLRRVATELHGALVDAREDR